MFVKDLIEAKILLDNITAGETVSKSISLQDKILFLIYDYGVASPQFLIKKLGVFKTNLAFGCKQLMLEGLLVSLKSEGDKRKIIYKLTKGGEERVERLFERIDAWFRDGEIDKEMECSLEKVIVLLNKKV
ncbi:MAG: hypothetical protein RR400_00355 [Clostridia bacterium]